MHWGIKLATLKNTILIFSRSSLLNLQTVQARSVLGNPPVNRFFVKPPKNRKFGRGFNLPLPSRMGGGAHYENPLRKPVSKYGVPQESISDHSYLFYMKIMSKMLWSPRPYHICRRCKFLIHQ